MEYYRQIFWSSGVDLPPLSHAAPRTVAHVNALRGVLPIREAADTLKIKIYVALPVVIAIGLYPNLPAFERLLLKL